MSGFVRNPGDVQAPRNLEWFKQQLTEREVTGLDSLCNAQEYFQQLQSEAPPIMDRYMQLVDRREGGGKKTHHHALSQAKEEYEAQLAGCSSYDD